jgi:tripartite ATP-independent transporter DctM subunit
MNQGLVAIAILVVLMLTGLPVGFAMALVGFTGFAFVVGVQPALAVAGQVAFDTVLQDALVTLPLFLLMGNLVGVSKMAEELYEASNAFLGHLRGGLAIATTVACGVFAAICGSSMATAASMAKISVPAMRRFGYSDRLATASVAAGGTLGIMIPPSTVMIVYGILTGTNIGQLFVAGIVPGILGIAGYIAAIAWTTTRDPAAGPPGPRTPWPERLRRLRKVGAILLLLLLIIGGIYFGIFTTIEAAGIGAGGAFIIALARGTLTFATLQRTLVDTARVTSMMFFLLIGALIFANYLEVSGFAKGMAAAVGGSGLPREAVLGLILVAYIVMGCFLESLSMTLLTIPVFFPIVVGLGYDPVWFGVLIVMVVEIALITPPVGLNVFVIRSLLPEVPVSTIFSGLTPFIAFDGVRLMLIAFVPALSLFLPRLMG